VKVVKRRGGELAQPVIVDVDAAPTPALPDRRTSLGSKEHFPRMPALRLACRGGDGEMLL
jgi:hypothetical protein